MKKIFLILLFILVIFAAGCNQSNVDGDMNQSILNKVKILTDTMNKLYSLEMTYEQYSSNTKDIFVNPAYLDTEEIFGINSKLYTLKDLKGMSLNQLQEYKGELVKNISSLPEITTFIYLSKVYDDPSHDWKIVFEKRIDSSTDSSGTAFEYYITKKYIFVKDNEVWRINGIETAKFNYYEEKAKRSGLTKEQMLDQNLHYVTFDNKPVEYIEQYTLTSSN